MLSQASELKSRIEYIDDIHTYLVDGVIVPSVSDLISFKFPNKYKFVNREVLGKAANRGTAVHNAIEEYEKTGADDESRYLKNYQFLKEHYQFKVIDTEQMVLIESYNGNLACGRFDMLIEKKSNELCFASGLGIADIKTTSTLDKESLAYQLNLYRIGYMQNTGKQIDFLAGLHIKEDVRKFVKMPINEKMAYGLIDEYSRRSGNYNRG